MNVSPPICTRDKWRVGTLVHLAGKHVHLNFGIFLSNVVGCSTPPSTEPLLQLVIPSEFVRHECLMR